LNKKIFKIALIGTRGIPARYGGFETFAEQLAKNIDKSKFKLTIYARRKFFEKKADQEHFGATVRFKPTIMSKYTETAINSFMCFIDLIVRRPDMVLVCNAANSPFAWIVRVLGIPLVINVDGIERKRGKWNVFGRLWYLLGEICSVLFANRVIADAEVISDYYKERYKNNPIVIAYGADAIKVQGQEFLDKFNLEKNKYILFLSRFEKENNPLGTIQAFTKISDQFPDIKLVLIGDAPYADEYKKELRNAANDKVVFTGYQFEDPCYQIRENALIYIQATEVGGTHPALIEAMAYQSCIIANGTPENVEVLYNTGLFYEKNDFDELSEKMKFLLNNPDKIKEFGLLAKNRANDVYNWDKITKQYQDLFMEYIK